MKNLIFFDIHCGMCRKTINFLGSKDRQKRFLFASLDGTTAEKMLIGGLSYLRNANTVILIEQPSGKIWLRGRAVFRILWLLGGKWKLVGWLYEMPFVNVVYKIVARYRKRGGDLPPLHVHVLP